MRKGTLVQTVPRTQKKIEDCLARPYSTELIRNDDGTYFARVVEFEGCMTEGPTKAEALENLDDATRLWLKVRIEDDLPIPEPFDVDGYSGKFLLRLPKTMHRDLARRADEEGVSINQLALAGIARIMGRTTDAESTRNIYLSPDAWNGFVSASSISIDRYGEPSRRLGYRVWASLDDRVALGYRIAASDATIWTIQGASTFPSDSPIGEQVELRSELANAIGGRPAPVRSVK
jgi:antitoxin HicB